MQQQEKTYVFRDLSLFPSANKLLKMHWAAQSKLRDKFQWLIREQGVVQFKGQVKVRFIRYTVKLQDNDNMAISGKKFFDALVRVGVIEDDKPSIVKVFHVEQYKVNKRDEEKIVIKIISLTI